MKPFLRFVSRPTAADAFQPPPPDNQIASKPSTVASLEKRAALSRHEFTAHAIASSLKETLREIADQTAANASRNALLRAQTDILTDLKQNINSLLEGIAKEQSEIKDGISSLKSLLIETAKQNSETRNQQLLIQAQIEGIINNSLISKDHSMPSHQAAQVNQNRLDSYNAQQFPPSPLTLTNNPTLSPKSTAITSNCDIVPKPTFIKMQTFSDRKTTLVENATNIRSVVAALTTQESCSLPLNSQTLLMQSSGAIARSIPTEDPVELSINYINQPRTPFDPKNPEFIHPQLLAHQKKHLDLIQCDTTDEEYEVEPKSVNTNMKNKHNIQANNSIKSDYRDDENENNHDAFVNSLFEKSLSQQQQQQSQRSLKQYIVPPVLSKTVARRLVGHDETSATSGVVRMSKDLRLNVLHQFRTRKGVVNYNVDIDASRAKRESKDSVGASESNNIKTPAGDEGATFDVARKRRGRPRKYDNPDSNNSALSRHNATSSKLKKDRADYSDDSDSYNESKYRKKLKK